MYRDEQAFSEKTITVSNSLAACIANVYWWMTFALLVSGACAWAVGTSEVLSKALIKNPTIFMVLLIAEFGLVMLISFLINKMAAATATALFIAYAVMNGITLGVIFLVYSIPSIAMTFCVTAVTFGVMAVVGTVTKKDLTSIGNLLYMALIGLIIATFVNIFWANSTLYWGVTYAGVIIFVGLTAYDAQKIKNMYMAAGTDNPEIVRKIAIMGALALYLDFINLFLYLLRIFGRRR